MEGEKGVSIEVGRVRRLPEVPVDELRVVGRGKLRTSKVLDCSYTDGDLPRWLLVVLKCLICTMIRRSMAAYANVRLGDRGLYVRIVDIVDELA